MRSNNHILWRNQSFWMFFEAVNILSPLHLHWTLKLKISKCKIPNKKNETFHFQGLSTCWRRKKGRKMLEWRLGLTCHVSTHVLLNMLNWKYEVSLIRMYVCCIWNHWRKCPAVCSLFLPSFAFCIVQLWLCVSLDVLLLSDCNGHFTNTSDKSDSPLCTPSVHTAPLCIP